MTQCRRLNAESEARECSGRAVWTKVDNSYTPMYKHGSPLGVGRSLVDPNQMGEVSLFLTFGCGNNGWLEDEYQGGQAYKVCLESDRHYADGHGSARLDSRYDPYRQVLGHEVHAPPSTSGTPPRLFVARPTSTQ